MFLRKPVNSNVLGYGTSFSENGQKGVTDLSGSQLTDKYYIDKNLFCILLYSTRYNIYINI